MYTHEQKICVLVVNKKYKSYKHKFKLKNCGKLNHLI